MKIETIKIDKIIPYARNARTHSDAQVAQIAASIREFGFNNPVLIDKDGGIIAGHGRVMAARQLDMDEIPCVRLGHLTDTQRRAYIIADNRLAETSGWDLQMLSLEIEQLQAENFDIDMTGFDADSLAALFADLEKDNANEGSEGLTDPDEVPEPPKEPITKPGDVWLMGVYYQCESCGKKYTKEEAEQIKECKC